MSETYITIYSGYVYFSKGTELYLKMRFDILEWGDSFALVPSDSGWYKIRSTKIGRFACWIRFVAFLQKRYPDHKGYFNLVPVPVQRNDFPQGTIALVFNAKGSVDSRYEFHNLLPKKIMERCVVCKDKIDVYTRGAQKCTKRVNVFKNNGIFAIVANRDGEFVTSHSMKRGNHFTIENPTLMTEMLAVSKRFDYIWRKDNVYYITDQPKMYQSVNSLDGFVKISSAVSPPPRGVRTSFWGRSSGNYLFFPKKCGIQAGDNVDLYEFGSICAFVVHPRGMLSVRKINCGRIGISSIELRRFLMEKYQMKNIRFYVIPAECCCSDYPKDARVWLMSIKPIRNGTRFDSRFERRSVRQLK